MNIILWILGTIGWILVGFVVAYFIFKITDDTEDLFFLIIFWPIALLFLVLSFALALFAVGNDFVRDLFEWVDGKFWRKQ